MSELDERCMDCMKNDPDKCSQCDVEDGKKFESDSVPLYQNLQKSAVRNLELNADFCRDAEKRHSGR